MMNRILLYTLFTTLLFSACGPKEPPTVVESLQLLSQCKNSKGQTVDAMTIEIFGPDMMNQSMDAATFNRNMDHAVPFVLDQWTNRINKDFLLDAPYMQCARTYMPIIKKFYESNPPKSEQNELMAFYNKKEHYVTFRVVPYLMMAVQNMPAQ